VDLLITVFLIVLLLAVLGSGLWIGLALLGVAVVAMELFTQRPVGDSMMLTIWGSTSSWTLTALPLFLWMGEILFRTRLSESMFRGLAPWIDRLPGRLLHTTSSAAQSSRRYRARARPPARPSARSPCPS